MSLFAPRSPHRSAVRRHRPLLALTACAAAALTGLPGVHPVAAAPTPAPAAGQKVCAFTDDRLDSVTGLAATAKGYDVVSSSGNNLVVYQLSASSCEVMRQITDSRSPTALEDLGATPDGALWVADIGNADNKRDTVVIWKFAPNADQATRYRLSYPDDKPNAASLLMQPNGTPVIVTKEAGFGRVFVPDGTLSAEQTTPLKQVGKITLAATGTPGGSVGPLGQRVFTGGAVSADGSRAVLRTFTDAYEWNVSGGDIATSIVNGKPRRTPLPNEPNGSAISYSTDGKYFLTVSAVAEPTIMQYTPLVSAPPVKPSASDKPADDSSGLSLTDITNLVIAIGVLGLLVLLAGLYGIHRSRRNQPADDTGPVEENVDTVTLPRVRDGNGRARSASRSEGLGRPDRVRSRGPMDRPRPRLRDRRGFPGEDQEPPYPPPAGRGRSRRRDPGDWPDEPPPPARPRRSRPPEDPPIRRRPR